MSYPAPTPSASPTSESWHYDTAGRNDTFTNRAGNIQTLTYDALNRLTQSAWNDSGWTPTVTYQYDIASRVIEIDNSASHVSRTYYDDNLLKTETQAVTGGTAKTITYTYDADSNRATMVYPGYNTFNYTYTGRDELKTVGVSVNNVTYAYDLNGNLATRTLVNNTSTSYTVDGMDRMTNITHSLVGTTRTLDYAYDNVSNRLWTKRDGGNGDVFGYDLADQSIAVKLDIPNPDTTSVGPQTIFYDASGNRTTFQPYGTTDTYQTNDLNQYSSRNGNSATYDDNGNPTIGVDTSHYLSDAQNRVRQAWKSGVLVLFAYDGLNRQVTRKVGTNATIYNVYDGWNLIEECDSAGTNQALYIYGTDGLFLSYVSTRNPVWMYHYTNGEGSVSHIADTAGNLKEWYRYDLQGTPFVYNASNQLQTGGTNYSVRHLFTGQQWYSEIGLYDLRNRFYSPDIGRFLQPDPIGFKDDATNLYRYCGNNSVSRWDPTGEWAIVRVSGNRVNIQIPIHFETRSGAPPPNGVIQAYVSGIERTWTGQFGRYQVTTSVQVVGSGQGNDVIVLSGAGMMRVWNGWVLGVLGYWSQGGTGMTGYDIGWEAAHEAGHLMWLSDQYRAVGDAIIPKAGFEKDIMGGANGTMPSEADIDAIIKASQAGFLTKLANGLKSLFGGSAYLGSAPSYVYWRGHAVTAGFLPPAGWVPVGSYVGVNVNFGVNGFDNPAAAAAWAAIDNWGDSVGGADGGAIVCGGQFRGIQEQ